jgi:hypothetical protein
MDNAQTFINQIAAATATTVEAAKRLDFLRAAVNPQAKLTQDQATLVVIVMREIATIENPTQLLLTTATWINSLSQS